jgi:hypothetical protein
MSGPDDPNGGILTVMANGKYSLGDEKLSVRPSRDIGSRGKHHDQV